MAPDEERRKLEGSGPTQKLRHDKPISLSEAATKATTSLQTQPGDHTSKLAMLNRTDSSLASQTFEATEKEPPGLAKPESGQRPLDLGLVVALAPWSRPRSTTNPCGHRVWGITKLGFQTFGFSKRRLIWSDTCLSRHGDGGKIFPNQGKIYSAKNGFMVQATWPHSSGV